MGSTKAHFRFPGSPSLPGGPGISFEDDAMDYKAEIQAINDHTAHIRKVREELQAERAKLDNAPKTFEDIPAEFAKRVTIDWREGEPDGTTVLDITDMVQAVLDEVADVAIRDFKLHQLIVSRPRLTSRVYVECQADLERKQEAIFP